MKKIPTLFKRDPDDRSRVLPELAVDIDTGRDWAYPIPKYDGTCVMFDGTDWWGRREVEAGKTPPAGFVELDHDETTGKRQGWVPITDHAEWKWHNVAIQAEVETYCPNHRTVPAGTYEAVGPHFQGNPHGYESDHLVGHVPVFGMPLHPFNFWFDDGTIHWNCVMSDMARCPWEGFVFYRDGEPVAKLKRRDFGLPWPIEESRG